MIQGQFSACFTWRRMTPVEKRPLPYTFHVHWKSLSVHWFNTQQRFAEHTDWFKVYIVVLIMCFATIFSLGTEELYLSFVKVNKDSMQCSDASLDHTDHLIILFISDFNCFSFLFEVKKLPSGGFDPRPLALLSSVWSNVPCLWLHQYQPWLLIYMY